MHPEFLRLLKKEANIPMLALMLLVISLVWVGFFSMPHTTTVYIGLDKAEYYYVNAKDQNDCTVNLQSQANIIKEKASFLCANALKKRMERESFDTFSVISVFLLILTSIRSIQNAHNDFVKNTWDYQKLSFFPVWSLAASKFLGGAALGFLGVIFNTIVFITINTPSPLTMFLILFSAFLAVSFAAIIPLLVYFYQVMEKRTPSLLMVWAFNIFAAVALSVMASELIDKKFLVWSGTGIFLAALFILLFVFLAGVVRLLEKDFGKPSFPILWFLGIICCIVLINQKSAIVLKFNASMICIALFPWITAILANKTPQRYRNIKSWKDVPHWIYGILAVLPLWVFLFFLSSPQDQKVYLYLLSIFGFLVRDICIMHFAPFWRNSDAQGEVYSLSLLFIVYVLLPLISPIMSPIEIVMLSWVVWGQALIAMGVLFFIVYKKNIRGCTR